jgi:hypothetical protein
MPQSLDTVCIIQRSWPASRVARDRRAPLGGVRLECEDALRDYADVWADPTQAERAGRVACNTPGGERPPGEGTRWAVGLYALREGPVALRREQRVGCTPSAQSGARGTSLIRRIGGAAQHGIGV